MSHTRGVFLCGNTLGCEAIFGDYRIVIAGEPACGGLQGDDVCGGTCEATIGVAEQDPVDAGVVALARDAGPGNTAEAMEGHHTRAVAVPGCLPAVDEPGGAGFGVHGAVGRCVEIAHHDGGQVGQMGKLLGDDVDRGEA